MPVFTVSGQRRWCLGYAEEGLGFGQVRGEERESWLSGAWVFVSLLAMQVKFQGSVSPRKRKGTVKLLFSARVAYDARSYDGGFKPRDKFSFCDCFLVCYCLEGNSKSSG